MKRIRKLAQKAVGVQRLDAPHGPSRLLERAATAAILLGMLLLFLLVRAEPQTLQPFSLLSLNDLRAEAGGASAEGRTGTVTANVSAIDVLEVLGASTEDATSAAIALREASPTRGQRLKPGTPLTAWFETGTDGQSRLVGVNAKLEPRATLVASRRGDGGFQASLLSARTSTVLHRISGQIETTLADAVIAAGGTRRQADAFASLFPEDQALSKGGQPGETFDLVVEMIADERGNFLDAGDLVFAGFQGKKAQGEWYRFTPEDTGLPEFYDARGRAGDEFLSREPVRGAAMTSGFGNRIHPITGENLLHAGVDFPAPTGTRVHAAGSGIITDKKFGEGYGWFIRIQHERGYETVYAHLSGFAEGLTEGQTVMRGDVIGYVGSTGSSTGAHLHFEILRNGFYVNPMTLALPSGRNLKTDTGIFASFEQQKHVIDTVRNAPSDTQMAATTYATATRYVSAPAP